MKKPSRFLLPLFLTANGSMTIAADANLSGQVYHWSTHGLLSGAQLERKANATSPSAQQVTNATGGYEFAATPAGAVALSASLTASDADLNRTITSADALAALKIAVGLNPNSDPDGTGPQESLPVSPYQLMAADLNGDGRVTSADALAILKVAVGLSDALVPSWRLVPDDLPLWDTNNTKSTVFKGQAEYGVNYPEQTELNFVAILAGDVNASWNVTTETRVDDDYFMVLAARYEQAPELWRVRDTDADGLSDIQEGAIGTNAFSRDTDDDGIPDGQDIAPLDDTEGLDTDLDGIGNNADLDDDNDGIPDGLDLFPLDPLESADTDLDGIGDNRDFDIDGDGIPNEIDSDPFVSGRDSDGDGVLDIFDPLPNNAANFNDSDNDGVVDLLDVDPISAEVTKKVAFNLQSVKDVAYTESVKLLSDGALNGLRPRQANAAKANADLLGNDAANDLSLVARTNLLGWNEEKQQVLDAILSDGSMFVGEAVLSPNGEYVYLLTSTGLQARLGDVLEPEVCQLYRVDLIRNNEFKCIVGVGEDIPEIYPIIISNSLRDDYTRQGMTFLADGTALLQAVNAGQVLVKPDGSWELLKSGKTAPEGYIVEDELGFWLNEKTYAIGGWIYPEGGGGSTGFWVAIDLETREVLGERDRSGGNIVQKDGVIYDGSSAFSWNGSEFVQEANLSAPIQDPYGNLWDYQEYSHDDRPYIIQNLTTGFTIELTDAAEGHYADDNQSGTGSDIKYKQYYFQDQYVAYKYVYAAKTPVIKLNGEPFTNNTSYNLGGNAGTLVTADRWGFWMYFKSGNEAEDVVIPYTARLEDGSEEDREYLIPLSAIVAHAAEFPQIISNPTIEDTYENEPLTIRFANPESRRVTFCLVNTETTQKQCADLNAFDVRNVDLETDRGPRYFPSDYYACPDYSCNAYPGVLQVLISGGRLFGYFKDSTDNQYYEAQVDIDAFMNSGSETMVFRPVQNGAGESEIIAAAARLKGDVQKRLAGVTATYDKGTITIDFAQPMSGLVAEPSVTMQLLNAETQIDLASIEWNAERTGLILQVQDKTQLEIAEYELGIQDWLFTKNSALRAVLAEPLLLNMTQALITEDIDTDGDGIGNKVDEDDDGDGVADTDDVFPLDGTETVDFDGDGLGDNADTDDDNDGLEDGADAFPFDATEYLDTDGDGTGNNADTDDDNDTVEDANDAFPLDPAASVDTDDDGAPDDWNEGKSAQDSTTGLMLDTDDDNDGTVDEGDAFPLDASESRDTDLDGTGDNTDTDDDNDGVEDDNDAFPLDPAASVDTDADGQPDDWNEGATATDSTTNLTVDDDDDGDGVADSEDEFPLDPTRSIDTDGDGVDNTVDDDDDNDGVLDGDDAFPLDPAASVDTDADGLPDSWNEGYTEADSTTGLTLDLDANGNGIPDSEETGGNGGTGALEDLILYYDGAVGADWDLGLCVYDIGAQAETCFGDAPSNDQGVVTWTTVDSGDATRGSALSVTFDAANDAVFYVQSSDAVDISAFADGGVLSFDLKVSQGVYDNGFMFKADCFYPCTSNNIPLVDPTLNPDEWIRVEYPVADLEARGLVLAEVNNGIAVFPTPTFQQGKSFDIANIRYTVNSTEAVNRDFDSDGVLDRDDAFPQDPAASVDTDRDGFPDDWNEGYSISDSTTGLNLDDDDDNDGVLDIDDAYPTDPNRSQNEALGVDSDNDGTLDEQDAFPDDPAASVDTDQDGLPDDWNAGFTASDSTTGLTLDDDDDNDGILDADDLFATTADEGGYLADDLVASPYGVVRFIPGIGDDPILLTGFENAAWQLNADGTFVAHTDDPSQAATGTWEAKANGYILSYTRSQAFGREFTREQLRNVDSTALATLVGDVSQPFELQVNEQWVVTLGIYLHGPLGWGVAYSTEQHVFAAADGLALDPSAPIFQSGGGIDRNGVLPADKPTVPFTAEELAGSWLLEGLNSDAQDSDAQCNLGPCSDVLIVAADNTAQTLYSNRTATWQIDAAGALLLTFDDTAVEYSIERFDAGPEAQTVLVRFTQGDRLYAKMSMLIAQDQPVSNDLSAYYDQVLSSSYFVTAHPDRSGYRRDASDHLIDNFAFVLNSADGTGVQVAVNSERLSASGMIIQPAATSTQAITWAELNGTIEIERCYQLVADAQGNDVCALKQVRELQPVKLTATRLYVRENLTVLQDSDLDGAFDVQHYVISRPNFYEITPYYDIDDYDRDGVTNELDAYPADPTQN